MRLKATMAIAAEAPAPVAPLSIEVPPIPVEGSPAPPPPARVSSKSVDLTIEVPAASTAATARPARSTDQPAPASTPAPQAPTTAPVGEHVEPLALAPRATALPGLSHSPWADLDPEQVGEDLTTVVETLTSAGPFIDPAAGVALLAVGLRAALPLHDTVGLSFAGRPGEQAAAWAFSFATPDPVRDCGAVLTWRPTDQGPVVEVGTGTTATTVLHLPVLALTPDRRRVAALDAVCASGAPWRLREALTAFARYRAETRDDGWLESRMERDGTAFADETTLWARTFGGLDVLTPSIAQVSGHLMAGLVWVRDMATEVGATVVVDRLAFADGFADLARLAASGT